MNTPTAFFSAAARHLRITQPAVSRRVRLLEKEIGVALLQKQGRGVVPTHAGEIMLSRATDLQRSAGAIYEEVRAGAAVRTACAVRPKLAYRFPSGRHHRPHDQRARPRRTVIIRP